MRRYRDVQVLVVAQLELWATRVRRIPRQPNDERAAHAQREDEETHVVLFVLVVHGTTLFACTRLAVLQQLDGRHHPRLATNVACQHGTARSTSSGGAVLHQGDCRSTRRTPLQQQ